MGEQGWSEDRDAGAGGGLVVFMPDHMAGRAVAVSPLSDDEGRVLAEVRARSTTLGLRHAAVFPRLARGHWTLWGSDGSPVLVIELRDDEPTEVSWPGPAR